jgi:hypothetical protein
MIPSLSLGMQNSKRVPNPINTHELIHWFSLPYISSRWCHVSAIRQGQSMSKFLQKDINKDTKQLGVTLSTKSGLTYKNFGQRKSKSTRKEKNDAFDYYDRNPFVEISRLFILDSHRA